MALTTDAQELAHRESVTLTPEATAEYLQDALGQKLVAYLAGVSPKTVGRWVDGQRSPKGAYADRLLSINYIFRTLCQVESNHTARAWLVGMNPLLDDEAPAKLIRDGNERQVVAAAQAFVSDG